MTRDQRSAIRNAFGSAPSYDANAHIQRRTAERLADRIAALPLPANPRVLEIGCGTGLLTRAALGRGVGGDWLVTDIAPEMVERCRTNVGEAPHRHFAVLDGEYGTPPGQPYDLICSSLAMQWFDDQTVAVERMLEWLAPGGHCLFTTLGSETFSEWRSAHEAEGLTAGTPQFPPLATFQSMHADAQTMPPHVALEWEQHDDARQFLKSLRAIGAQTSDAGHRPLSPGDLRRVMRRFEKGGSRVTYEVVTCHFTQGS